MADTVPTQGPPPQSIFLIRHGEKPEAPTDTGLDASGAPNPACLTPRGWQRAAGLATLFTTVGDTSRPGLAVPTHLYSPDYPHHEGNHRTYETLLPLSQSLGLSITTPYSEGQEPELAASILATDTGISLVCWEHSRIPDIAAHIPVAIGVVVPRAWPDDRFDVIWSFTRAAGDTATYDFTVLPELLLPGDAPV